MSDGRNPALQGAVARGRRRFMVSAGASAAVLLLPGAVRAQGAGTDVAIVGAGAAGIVAAGHLKAAGLRVLVLEARDRVGGRAWTDTSSVGVPWDRGCARLQAGAANAWIGYARDNGFDLVAAAPQRVVRDGLKPLGTAESAAWRALGERLQAELDAAGRRGLDIAGEAALTRATHDDPWYPLAVASLAEREGAEPAGVSALDRFRGARAGEEYRVEKGCGVLLAHAARDLDLRLRTPVSRVRWGARSVTLETPAGTATARAAIIAVPPSQITQGALAFAPQLPLEALEAHHHLPLGLINGVALRFRRNVLPGDTPELLRLARQDLRGMSYATRVAGAGVIVGQAGGAFAHELEAAGETAAIEHALGELVRLFGGDLRRQFERGAATAWMADPYSRGARSHCIPGRFGARAILTRPVGGRIVFAGEHTEQGAYGTVHGAAASGVRAARQVLALLAGR